MAVELQLSEFSGRGVAHTASALATELTDSLAMAADLRQSVWIAQGFANMAWAFATVRHRCEMLCAVFAISVKWWLSEFSARSVANSSWACARVV